MFDDFTAQVQCDELIDSQFDDYQYLCEEC